MRRILHIRTQLADTLVNDIVKRQAEPETIIATIDLTAGGADYDALLDRIFEADSVQVW